MDPSTFNDIQTSVTNPDDCVLLFINHPHDSKNSSQVTCNNNTVLITKYANKLIKQSLLDQYKSAVLHTKSYNYIYMYVYMCLKVHHRYSKIKWQCL